MKIKVNRRLTSGKYTVNFQVSDFSQEELGKMASFGIPNISMILVASNGARSSISVALNQVNPSFNSSFNTEEEAKKYEEGILNQIRTAMQRLRESQDKFTSSDEVTL